MSLKPFFSFYGGKWRIAPRYPKPEFSRLVEPFAGSAGYALRYPESKVELYDIEPVIAGVWSYLIQVSEEEVRCLPIGFQNVDDLLVPQEARWLMGFWLNKACVQPMKSPAAWMRGRLRPNSFWGEAIRERIASQLQYIRHWKVFNESYWKASQGFATWFVDPPYSNPAGRLYKHNKIDYGALSCWCKSREGQVIVCEQEGADWLPFEPFYLAKATEGDRGKKVSREAIWVQTS